MNKYIKLSSCFLLICLLLTGLTSCSEGKKNAETSPEIATPEDVYIVSLYSFVSGGLSYYDYDSDGRLLSITPVDPSTMRLADDAAGMSVKYSYSKDGKLSAVNYLSCDMELEYSSDGTVTGANYTDEEGSLKIEFEYGEEGRIKKETVYSDNELFLVSEYNSIGMLSKETMSLVGDATYLYTESYSKAEYTLSYSEVMTYKIEKNSKGLPSLMTSTSAQSVQTMLWEYTESDLCIAYTEKTQNSETRYEHTYDGKDRLIETKSFYKALDDEAYMQELIEYSYDEADNIKSDKYSAFNNDGSPLSVKYNEYKEGLCTKEVEELYTAGVIEKRSVTVSEYNNDDLVTMFENTVYLADGKIDSRVVNSIEYNSEKRISKVTTKNYEKGDVYEGSFVEEYEYNESGGYKLTISAYDADGNLKNKTEEEIDE